MEYLAVCLAAVLVSPLYCYRLGGPSHGGTRALGLTRTLAEGK